MGISVSILISVEKKTKVKTICRSPSMDTQISIKEEIFVKQENCADVSQTSALGHYLYLTESEQEKVLVKHESATMWNEPEPLRQQQTFRDDPEVINFEINKPVVEELIIKDEILDGVCDHVETHVKTFQCEMCNKKYSTSINLQKHNMKAHTGIEYFECSVCNKKFPTRSSFSRHMDIHNEDKLFECEICNKKYSSASKLRRHIKSHAYAHKCDICKKKFTEKCSLQQHMRIHTGEKPFECTICRRKFRTQTHLKGHMITHTGEKPYACVICSKRFSAKHALRIHMNKKKGFECEICKKKFKAKHYLSHHMRNFHNGEKPAQVRKSDGNNGEMGSPVKDDICVKLEISRKLSPNLLDDAPDGHFSLIEIKEEFLDTE